MHSIEYQHSGDYVKEITRTNNQVAVAVGHIPYRQLRISLSDGQLINNGSDTETITVKVVSGLDVARGDTPSVLDYDGDVTVFVDGDATTKTLTNGTLSFEITSNKSAGSEIEIIAESLADHPAESDIKTIDVVSG